MRSTFTQSTAASEIAVRVPYSVVPLLAGFQAGGSERDSDFASSRRSGTLDLMKRFA